MSQITNFSSNTSVAVSAATHNSNFSSAAIQPYIFPRIPPSSAGGNNNNSGSNSNAEQGYSLYSVLNTVTGKNDLSPTFWVPDTSKGEYSLLAALIKRQSLHLSPDDYLPLVMRPDIELANNFSTFRNERIDLSGDKFKLSKVTQTLSQLGKSDGSGGVAAGLNASSPAMLSMEDVKEGLRTGLSSLQVDEFFLVKYRDYSEFATSRWTEEAQRERFLSPKYVEKYFAVRVGSRHGVFIPITENQFVRGTEILSTANMAPESYAKDKFFVSLSSDQFKALGAPSIEFNAKEANTGNNANATANQNNMEDPDLDLPPPPHPLDFSAEAFNTRWRRFTRRQYHYFGRLAIKIAIAGAVVYFIRYTYFPPSKNSNNQLEDKRSSSRGSSRSSRSSSSQVMRDVISLPVNLLGALIGGNNNSRRRDDYDD